MKNLEVESAFRLRQLELQGSHALGNVSLSSDSNAVFNVSKHVSLVPIFHETEVETYFTAFERIARALHWPDDRWAILLQCKLTGKAQEACAALSIEDSLVYEKVKTAVLRVYELVPEAYRQRFRNLKKTQTQTCVDFSREMGILFDRWCSACKVDELASLRELILIEQFKDCMPERTVINLNEQKVTTLQQAAVLADELSLTHKNIFVGPEAYSRGDFPSPRGSASRVDDRRAFQTRPLPSKVAEVCRYCKKPGHVMSQCFLLRRKEEAKTTAQRTKGVGLIKTVSCHGQNDSEESG